MESRLGARRRSNKMRLAAIGATLRGLWPEDMLPSSVGIYSHCSWVDIRVNSCFLEDL